MTNPQVVPFLVQKFLYINDCNTILNPTTPNTQINVSQGLCRDQSDTYDLNIGNFDNFQQTPAANSTTTINALVKGLNGLDTGTLAASSLYYIYVVADPVSGNQTGAMISLAEPQVGPLMPFGYSAYRNIGFVATDSSAHFIPYYENASENTRVITFDAPQATSVTAGTSATYAAINLSALVPEYNDLLVNVYVNWAANAAGDVFNMQGGASTGDAFTAIAPVAGGTANTTLHANVLAQLVAGVPTVNYKVSAGTVAINVASYTYSL